jgi:hypothetical protein
MIPAFSEQMFRRTHNRLKSQTGKHKAPRI